jgi:hypothetical protein
MKKLKNYKENVCNCNSCKEACAYTRPCWGTPQEIQKIIDAGFGDKLMLDCWAAPDSADMIDGYAHNLMSAQEARNPQDMKKGFYLYRDEETGCIKVLVVHNPNLLETINLTTIVEGKHRLQEEIGGLCFPGTGRIKIKLSKELADLIESNCEYALIDFYMIVPAIRNFEQLKSPCRPIGECTFHNKNQLCDLHNLKLKPLEGKLASCSHTRKDIYIIHEAIAKTWNTKIGREVVDKWCYKYFLERNKNFDFNLFDFYLPSLCNY